MGYIPVWPKLIRNQCLITIFICSPSPSPFLWFSLPGELHVPLEVCGAVVKRELDFWQIKELEIKACCWRHYRSYIENQNILNSFNHSLRSQAVDVDIEELKGWKRIQWKVWMVLEFPRTSRLAMVRIVFLLLCFLCVYVCVCKFNSLLTVK